MLKPKPRPSVQTVPSELQI